MEELAQEGGQEGAALWLQWKGHYERRRTMTGAVFCDICT